MFGFGKKVNKVKAEVKKMENRDLLEAIVGGVPAGCGRRR